MIELKGVAKQYLYGAKVLGALDMRIEDGEIISVLGGEQSGKTTLAKVLAGVTECDGEVLVDGENVQNTTNAVIMQFDDLALFKRRSFYYNLAYPLRLRKTDKAETDKRVKEAARLLGITACLDMRAGKAELTEQKRLAAARLFLRDAKVLVLDDLTYGLDKSDAEGLWRDVAPLLQKKANDGVTVVYTTRDREEAFSIADKTAVMHAGEVKQFGTYKELRNKPQSLWAAQEADGDYNFEKAKLTFKDGSYMLCFENGEYCLDASALKDAVMGSYADKDVFAGWHSDGFSDSGRVEKVEYAMRRGDGFILVTASGKHVWSKTKRGEAHTLPNVNYVMLFDCEHENSIMK